MKKYNENYYHTTVRPIVLSLNEKVAAFFAGEGEYPSNQEFGELSCALGLRSANYDVADLLIVCTGISTHFVGLKEDLASIIKDPEYRDFAELLYAVYVNFFGRDYIIESRLGIHEAARLAVKAGLLYERSKHPDAMTDIYKAWDCSVYSKQAYEEASFDLPTRLVYTLFEYGCSKF